MRQEKLSLVVADLAFTCLSCSHLSGSMLLYCRALAVCKEARRMQGQCL